jgi:hypothetical protein
MIPLAFSSNPLPRRQTTGSVMVGSFIRLAAAGIVCALLAGCASEPEHGYSVYGGGQVSQGGPLQCVPYARAQTGIPIYGDAYTWWEQAAGRYARSYEPSQGAVLVLYNYAGQDRAHLAVVRQIVSNREIHVDHANWLDDGSVYTDDPVMDVSPAGDWSQVRVFNPRTGAWGRRIYPVQGFIGPGSESGGGSVEVAQKPRNLDAIASLLAQQDTGDDDDTEGLQ